jgi:hypothetical protein
MMMFRMTFDQVRDYLGQELQHHWCSAELCGEDGYRREAKRRYRWSRVTWAMLERFRGGDYRARYRVWAKVERRVAGDAADFAAEDARRTAACAADDARWEQEEAERLEEEYGDWEDDEARSERPMRGMDM